MDRPWFPSAIGKFVSETVALPYVWDCWRIEYVADPGSAQSDVVEQMRRQSTLYCYAFAASFGRSSLRAPYPPSACRRVSS